jgi:hypothetical protein
METKVNFSRNLNSSWYSILSQLSNFTFSQPISVVFTFKIILLISVSILQMAVCQKLNRRIFCI